MFSGVKVSFLVLKSTFLVFFFGCFFHPWVVETVASPHRPPRLLEVLELPLFGFGLVLLVFLLSSQNELKKGKMSQSRKAAKAFDMFIFDHFFFTFRVGVASCSV